MHPNGIASRIVYEAAFVVYQHNIYFIYLRIFD
jgi:hypothetical protein